MAVFFKLHLLAAEMWWQCMWLGTPQWEQHALLHGICWSSRQDDDQEQARPFKSRFCGLVAPTGQALFSRVIVPSLETSLCYLRFFVHLLTYVGDAGIAAAHPEQHGISIAEWARLAHMP